MMCYNKEGGYVMRVKQIKYVIFALICMCVTPLITHAECDYQRLAELSRLASNVQLSYTYSEESGFQITMTNLTNDLYATNIYGQRINGGAERVFEAVSGSYNYDIYSNDSNCPGEFLLRKSINLPVRNSYSYYDECKQYPNFKYCQMWSNISVTHEQFMEELEQYKGNVEEMKDQLTTEKVSIFDTLLEVLGANWFMFVFLGVVVLLTLIIFFVKKKHK